MDDWIAVKAIAEFKQRFPLDVDRVESLGAESLAKSIAGKTSADHITASALVIDPKSRTLLLKWHQSLRTWLQPGGHVEHYDASLVCAAERELLEETGLKPSFIVSPATFDCPFDIDVHYIEIEHGHNAHFHIDFRFIFFADRGDADLYSPEGTEIRWIHPDDVIDPPLANDLRRTIQKLRFYGLL